MGKGDIKTKKGKIIAKSFGKSRPKKERNRLAAQEALKKAYQEEQAK